MQTNWTQGETNTFSKADDLYMSSFYEGGKLLEHQLGFEQWL